MNNKEISDQFKVIADESRLKIIRLLLKHEKLNATEMLPYLNCKQATLSHHMSVLEESDLVHSRKKGNKVEYWLNYKLLTYLSAILIRKADEESEIVKNPDIVREIDDGLIKEDDRTEEVPVYLL